jgi:hypothetical protein
MRRVLDRYDSSADYWKLNRDGTLSYDGEADLYDENGNIIYKSTNRGIQGSLSEILKISSDDAYALMKSAGLTWDGKTWLNDKNATDGSRVIGMDAKTKKGITYESLYKSVQITDSLTGITGTLEDHNPLNIYNAMVAAGRMDMGVVVTYDTTEERLYVTVAPISYDEYKANNFIRGQPSYQTNDSYSGYPVTTLMGAGGSLTANPHRGTDAGTPKGTAAQPLFFNDTSVVSTVGTDKDSAQGLYVTVKTDITYEFKGKDRTDSIYYRIMHLSETSVVETNRVTQTTVLGKSGNTGKLTNYSTGKDVVYGYHAHEDVYTQNMPSPYLDYLTGNTSNVTARLYYKPENRFFYDKFIFANKNNYTIRGDANTYN